MEQERMRHTCPGTETNPRTFSGQTVSSKRPSPSKPILWSAHTPSGKCWNAVWCLPEEATKPLTNVTCCRGAQKGIFLHPRKLRQAWRAWWIRWCCFKGYVWAHKQIYNAHILWKSFKQFGLKKSYMFNIRKGFLHKSTRGSIHIICLGPW